MFLCERVRSEMGVDSVGVGGGEPGGVRGRCAPVGGDPPRRRVHPLALREWAGVFFIFGALGGPAASRVLQTRRPQQFGRRLVEGEVAAVLGGPRGSAAGRLGRRWWCRGDPAPGQGEGRRAFSRARRRPGVLAGPGRTGGRRPGPVGRPPRRGRCRLGRPAATPLRSLVGDEPHGWRAPGWTTRAGDHGVGPGPPRAASGRPAGPSHSPARFALKRGRPLYDQHAPAAPLSAGSAHTRRPSRRPPPRPRGSRSSRPRARAPSMPRAHGDAGSGVPGTRWPGADHRRGP